MSALDKILSFGKTPSVLNEVLSYYLLVDANKIMSHLTEFELDTVAMWAYDNSVDVSDMLDVIQDNLNSLVNLSIKPTHLEDPVLLDSKLFIKYENKEYFLSLVWYLGE